jgi:hypothetical protein
MPGLQRRVSELSGDAVRTVRYIPRIVARVRNWPQFLITYMRLSERPRSTVCGAATRASSPAPASTSRRSP